MALFAVAHPRQGQEQFQVERCHVNLFLLRNRFGFSRFYWDVGILIRSISNEADVQIQLALPFGTDDASFEDLSDKMVDPAVATQVFGERVTVSGRDVRVPSYGEAFKIASISADSASKLEKLSDSRRSIWEIKVPVAEGARTYARMRFHVLISDAMWEWRPNAFVCDGALVDLRVSDIRGVAGKEWFALSERIAEIPYLNVLLIVPADLRLAVAYPTAKYARLIEPAVWEAYLRKKCRERLTVYHWKHQAGDKTPNLSPDNPFRAYIELVSHSRVLSLRELVRLGVATMVLFICSAVLFGSTPIWVTHALDALRSLGSTATTLAGAGVLVVISRIRPVVGMASSAFVFMRGRGWKKWGR
jgi:hypothetical protein